MLELLPLLPVVLLGGVLLLALLEVLIRWVSAGVALILAVAALGALAGDLPAVSLGPLAVTPSDVLLVMLGAAAAARLLRGAALPGAGLAIAGLALLVTVSVVRGVGEFGLATAVNEARSTLAFLAAVLYVATVEPTAGRRERIAQLWLAYAGFLIALAAFRWAVVAASLPLTGYWYEPEAYGGMRVLWSDESLLLGQTFLILLPAWLRGALPVRMRIVAVAALLCALALQHRSVWAVTLVGAAGVLALEGAVGARVARRLMIAAVAAAVLLLTAFSGPAQQQLLRGGDAASTDTFEWRVEGWGILLRDAGPEGPVDSVAGRPYGTGWERRLSLGYTTDVAPHNFYLELFLRVGMVGLALFLLAYAAAVGRLARRGGVRLGPRLADRTLGVLLVAQLVYYLPYSPALEQAIVVGLAIGALQAPRARAYAPSSADSATAGVYASS